MNLWNYQVAAAEHIINNPEAGLFLDMGLGKTAITLTALKDLLFDSFAVSHVLVIAPLRVAKVTWPTEIHKWSPEISFAVAVGSEKERLAALSEDVSLHIINREQVQWLVEHYKNKWPFDMVIIDELSSFKSSSSQRFRSLKKVRKHIKRFVGLTGTPAPNSLMELWPELYLIDGGSRLGRTLTSYRDAYFVPGKRNGHIVYEWIPRPGAEEVIYDRISDVCISMKAEDYLELPERIDIPVPVSIPEESRKIIEEMKKEYIVELGADVVTSANAAVLANVLIQMANGAVYVESSGFRELNSAKLDALSEITEAASGEPLLVFYWFKHDLERLRLRFPEARELKTEDDIADWNNHKIKIAFAHPASTGHGLNLQYGGSVIVWFSLVWSLELYQQANARLLRQGQTKPVRIYHLIAENSIDEKVMKALTDKDMKQQRLIEAVKAVL